MKLGNMSSKFVVEGTRPLIELAYMNIASKLVYFFTLSSPNVLERFTIQFPLFIQGTNVLLLTDSSSYHCHYHHHRYRLFPNYYPTLFAL